MQSKDWAQDTKDIKATDGISNPGLLIQWRLKLRQDQRATLDPATYLAGLAKLPPAVMNLGEGWQGQKLAVFGTGNLPGESY